MKIKLFRTMLLMVFTIFALPLWSQDDEPNPFILSLVSQDPDATVNFGFGSFTVTAGESIEIQEDYSLLGELCVYFDYDNEYTFDVTIDTPDGLTYLYPEDFEFDEDYGCYVCWNIANYIEDVPGQIITVNVYKTRPDNFSITLVSDDPDSYVDFGFESVEVHPGETKNIDFETFYGDFRLFSDWDNYTFDIEIELPNGGQYLDQEDFEFDDDYGCYVHHNFPLSPYITGQNVIVHIKSLAQAYAWLSSTGQFTLCYDNLRSSRAGQTFDLLYEIDDEDPEGKYSEGPLYPGWYLADVSSVTTVYINSEFANVKPYHTSWWFNGMTNLKSVLNLKYLNTSSVKFMDYMFSGCSSLTALGLGTINTSNAEGMRYMFKDCTSLGYVNLGNMKFSNIDTEGIFDGCESLSYLKINTDPDPSNTNPNLFKGIGTKHPCTLKAPSGFNFSTNNFRWKEGLFTLNEPYANLSSDHKSLVFYYDQLRNSRTGTNYDLNWTKGMPFWYNYRSDIETVTFNSSFYDARPINTYYWFFQMNNLTAINNLNYLNTSNVRDMGFMFYGCSNLNSIEVGGFDTSNVMNMNNMFGSCSGLISLDLSNFDTSNLKNMNSMFSYCTGLKTLNLSNFNTSNVWIMYYTFNNCTSLESIDISSFDTSNVTNMQGMFENCKSLTSLDVSNFDTSKVTSSGGIFQSCSGLTYLHISPTMDNLYSNACNGIGTVSNPCIIEAPKTFNFSAGSYFRWKQGYFKLYIPSITIPSGGLSTYCYENDLDFSGITDFKVYIAAGYNKSTGSVILLSVKEVPAGTGLIVKGTPGTYEIPISESSTYYTNLLVGTTKAVTIQSTEGDKSNFILAVKNGKTGFYPLSGSTPMPAKKAYLQLPTSFVSSNANCVGLEFEDEADDIEGIITNVQPDTVWYTIDGRRLDGKPAQKGIYINNGKKVVVE